MFTLNTNLAQLIRAITRGDRGLISTDSSAPDKEGGPGKAGKACPEPSTGTKINDNDLEEVFECADDTCSSATADRDEEEAAAADATRVHIFSRNATENCGRLRRSVFAAWVDYVGAHIKSINAGPSVLPRTDSVVQWFCFTTLVPPPSPGVPDYGKFTMADAQFSWENDGPCPVTWIDDPSRQFSSGSFDPRLISGSIDSRNYETPSSVPTSVPKVDPEETLVNGSVESGRVVRGTLDGIWRLPDGSKHPRNLYNDLDTDYEDSGSFVY